MSATVTQAPPPAAANREPHPLRWVILAVVLLAELMDLLDATIVNIAAPSIRADLGGSTAALQWLGAAYTLTFAVFLITGGRLGDLYGRRRMFLIGAAGFTVASAACATAQSPGMLIGARIAQGAFGAVLIPQGFGIIKEVFADDFNKAFAAFGPVMGLTAVAAPIVGGLLIDADAFGTGWRAIFLVNLPVGLLALAGAVRFIPRGRPVGGPRLDAGGVAILSLASFALVYPLVQGRELGWPVWIFALLAAGLLGFAAFVGYERRRDVAPLIEPGLLRNHAYTSGIAVAMGFFAAMIGLTLVLSLFCQLGLGWGPLHTGLAMAPLPFGIALTAPASFGLVPRFGRKVIQAGLLINTAGFGLLAASAAHFETDITAWGLAPGLLVAGLGMGLVLPPLFNLILAGVADHEVGSASGVLNAVQQLAAAIGLAVVGTVFFAFADHGHTASTALAGTALLTIVPLAGAFALGFRLPRMAREDVIA